MNKAAIFWFFLCGLFLVSITILANAIKPFFIAFIIAYLLQPAVDFLSIRFKLSRTPTTSIIFLIFLTIFLITFIILLPIIYQQITVFINNLPQYKNYFQTEIIPPIMNIVYSLEPSIAAKVKDSLSSLINGIFTILSNLANNFWRYTMVTINILVLFLLIPIISFYFLRDWSKIIEIMHSLLPIKSKEKILDTLSSINNLLSAYIRGQLNICLLLSAYYSIGLTLIGIDLALLLGVFAGFLVIIPFIGTFISFSMTLIIGYFTFGAHAELIYIMAIFLIGNICETYILAPKIIGDKIGLHPVWIIFAIFACGSLFGFTGIFFAIPIAGITKILLANIVELYKSSKFYK